MILLQQLHQLKNMATEPPIYATKQNHTMLPIYIGVNACILTKQATCVATV